MICNKCVDDLQKATFYIRHLQMKRIYYVINTLKLFLSHEITIRNK